MNSRYMPKKTKLMKKSRLPPLDAETLGLKSSRRTRSNARGAVLHTQALRNESIVDNHYTMGTSIFDIVNLHADDSTEGFIRIKSEQALSDHESGEK